MNKNLKKQKVFVQKWEESELGWGTRPDGFSLHLSVADVKIYIKKYWESMPDSTPAEYSRPDGTPYISGVDTKTFIKVQASKKHGIRRQGMPPGSGGSDGWVSVSPELLTVAK